MSPALCWRHWQQVQSQWWIDMKGIMAAPGARGQNTDTDDTDAVEPFKVVWRSRRCESK
jgi:hypothetical protein